jgi:hypothetical protein
MHHFQGFVNTSHISKVFDQGSCYPVAFQNLRMVVQHTASHINEFWVWCPSRSIHAHEDFFHLLKSIITGGLCVAVAYCQAGVRRPLLLCKVRERTGQT